MSPLRVVVLPLILCAFLLPASALADHRPAGAVQGELDDLVRTAREELAALDELVNAADSRAVQRELHRKAELIDGLLARIPALTDELRRGTGGGGAYVGASTPGGSVGISVGAGPLGGGVLVVVEDDEPEVVEVVEVYDAGPSACSEGDLQAVASAVAGETFAKEQLAVLADAARDRWFSAMQARRLMELFTFDSDKVEAGALLYPRVVDTENWFKVYEVFTFDSDKQKLRRRVGR